MILEKRAHEAKHTSQGGISAGHAAATAAELLQSCLTLCDPIDSSPPGSPVQKQKILKRGGKNTQKNYIKNIFMTQITMMV